MVVRLTRFSVSPDRVKEAKKIYEEEVIPEVEKQKGNTNVILLEPTNGSNEFISMTAWESNADADAYQSSGKYQELVDKIRDMITGQPILTTYNS